MAYFVTGATGFIGRYLVQELLDNREGEIFVLCREGSKGRLESLIEDWTAEGGDGSRVTPVIGDLGEPDLGVTHQWITAHAGEVEHFFHVAAIYDMAASDEMNETMNVGGTRNAIGLPDEGYGFSNNAPAIFGLPSFSRVRIAIPRDNMTTSIRLRYP